MIKYSPITDEIKTAIRERIGADSIISGPEKLADYAGDASTLSFTPELVVLAKSVSDVQAIMELANKYHFPVTPRGGGSGLAGACLPSVGGVVLFALVVTYLISNDDVFYGYDESANILKKELEKSKTSIFGQIYDTQKRFVVFYERDLDLEEEEKTGIWQE